MTRFHPGLAFLQQGAHWGPAVLVYAGVLRWAHLLRPRPTVLLIEALRGDVGRAGRHHALARRERHCGAQLSILVVSCAVACLALLCAYGGWGGFGW